MHKITIGILNFNAGDYLLENLEAIKNVSSEADITVIVADNASTDGSFELAQKKFPKYQYLDNGNNLGFGHGVNQILKQVKTEYVLILNPDARLEKGTLSFMLNYMEKNPEVGAASCKVEKENGTLDIASHRGFPTPWASFKYYFLKDDSLYHLSDRDMSVAHEVDAIVGAFFLTRKSVLDKVGMFDEDYFMYAEDIDLCLRIKQAGYKIMYLPEVKVIHYKGVSSGLKKETQQITSANSQSRLKAFNAFYESMLIFYRKHYQSQYPFFINWLVFLGIHFKWWLAKRKMVV